MITLKPETLEELFLSKLREWNRVRDIDSDEFQKLSDYLSELAYSLDGEVNPDLIVDEVFLNGVEILRKKDATC